MVALIIVLFAKTPDVSVKDILWVRNFTVHKIVLILVAFMPILSFFNLWDSYLSWSLYSGNFKHFEVRPSEDVITRTPGYVQSFIHGGRVDVSEWSFAELNAAHYPEDRVIKSIGKYFCSYAKSPKDVNVRFKKRFSLANYDYSLDCRGL
jgi:hypothetical protein